MHSGCLLMLAPGGVDTSSWLSLSLPGGDGAGLQKYPLGRPASQPEIQSTQIADGAVI